MPAKWEDCVEDWFRQNDCPYRVLQQEIVPQLAIQRQWIEATSRKSIEIEILVYHGTPQYSNT